MALRKSRKDSCLTEISFSGCREGHKMHTVCMCESAHFVCVVSDMRMYIYIYI